MAELGRFWSVTAARAADRLSLRLGDALADGCWTAPWPAMEGFLPLAGLALGALAPLLGVDVFTESRLFTFPAVAGSYLSGAFGVATCVGYALADLLRLGPPAAQGAALVNRAGSAVVGWLLLGLLTVAFPLLARRMAEETGRRGGKVVEALLFGAGAAGLTWIWCQAAVALLRPVFTFAGGSPTTKAIAPVQEGWGPLVAVAAGAALLRCAGEALARRAGAERIRERQETRFPHGPPAPGRVPWLLQALAGAGLVALLLAGLYSRPLDVVPVLGLALLLEVLRRGRLLPRAWVRTVGRVPLLLRLAVVPLVGYALSRAAIGPFMGRTESFYPVLLGAMLTLAVFALLFPKGDPK